MKFASFSVRRWLLVAGQAALTASVAAWYLLAAPAEVIRPVKVDYRGMGGLHVADSSLEIASAEEFDRKIGVLNSTLPAVHFDDAKLVRIQWVDKGPLNAQLCWRSRWLGRSVQFFVSKPSSNYSTFVEQLNESWFAVPASWQVALVSRQKVVLTDAAFVAFIILQPVVTIVFLARQSARCFQRGSRKATFQSPANHPAPASPR